MDDPALDPAEHRRALEGLARLNRFSGSARVQWPAIGALARKLRRPVSVLDVATGAGDVPAGLLARARRAGIVLEVAGCDVSPVAVATAERTCPAGRFFVHDVLGEPLPGRFDVVACSLFLHHLSSAEAILLLTRLREAAQHLVLVNDLVRSRLNYLSVALACRVLSGSRIVRFDGPASVRSAFNRTEALELADAAGLTGARVERRLPCRFLLTWSRG
jgi:2-polyprenyl-3-methyl-5-hydroxy-6-metoxy-1,4-benzoquinol methylase